MEKEFFWADQLANRIISRKNWMYLNKKYDLPKEGIVIKSSTSISGVPHIGNACDIIRADAVVKSLKEKFDKVTFIWVAEDMDPLRKIPLGLPKGFARYLGMPVSALPCPFDCCESYVFHFVSRFVKSIQEQFDCDIDPIYMSKEYSSKRLLKYVIQAINSRETIRSILNRSRSKKLSSSWFPWMPVCPECKKIVTTRVKKIEEMDIYFECKDFLFKEYGKSAYTSIKGCNTESVIPLRKCEGKLGWRIEWAAQWPLWNVCFEPFGKEHGVKGGSFWSACEIVEKIFDYPAPFVGKNPLQPYEYILVNNEKMSASKGNTVATWEWPEFAPPETLRLLFLKKPNKQRNFSYNEIPRLCTELDELLAEYSKMRLNSKKAIHRKRLIEIVSREKVLSPLSFNFISSIVQIFGEKSLERLIAFCQHNLKKTLTEKEVSLIKDRINQAKGWLKKYAPKESRISLIADVNNVVGKLTSVQKKTLVEIADLLEKQPDLTDVELQDAIWRIGNKNGLSGKETFQAAYLVLLGKTSGPKLAPFILALHKNFVINRFKLLA